MRIKHLMTNPLMRYLLLILLLVTLGSTQGLITNIGKYKNGNVSQITYYKKNGNTIELNKIESYYKNGQKKYDRTFKNGERTGKWTYWYDDGKIECIGTYRDGELVREWIFYNIDGSIKEPISDRSFVQGYDEYIGISSYNYSGPIFKMNNPSYHEEREKDYRDYVTGKGNLLNGEKDGFWIFFDKNGNTTKEANFQDGERFGKWVFYDNGKISQEGFYNGANELGSSYNPYKIGLWIEYYNNGKKSSEKNYNSKGKRDGEWTYYNEDGTIDRIKIYKDGELVD